MTAAQPFDSATFLKSLTSRPGVYQMLDHEAKVLYIGKAKNLKNRVSSYFRNRGLNSKTVALVSKIDSIQVTVTNSEAEALILEQNLIKAHRPQYNILLRDDKSYPYIYLSNHEFPRLGFHRGAKRAKGEYFGPYPSAGSVRESLHHLQKVFRVRQCDDSYYRNRSRPCLQHQIDRCTAPCVAKVNADDYADDVRFTRMFLNGQDQQLLKELAERMEAASATLEFERAAMIRDQLTDLRRMQDEQFIEGKRGDVDVLAASQTSGIACVHVLFVRAGRVLGSRSYYPAPKLEEGSAELLFSFISQYYLGGMAREIPREIVIDQEIPDLDVLVSALSEYSNRKITVHHKVRSNRAEWVKLAVTAAQQNLEARLANRQSIASRFEALQEALQLSELPQRIECFDISHSSGEATVASCVVFDLSGARKTDYRRFNIEGVQAGDDYAAMAQALRRRFTRLQKGEGRKPDIVLIDGGKGQLSEAEAVLNELKLVDICVLAVAKGPTRKAGMEQIIKADNREELVLASDSAALHLIQQVRDESHRFAITGHRARRAKKRNTSALESIEGIGSKRRQALLRYFGGLQEIQRASVQDLSKVPGISEKTASDIYNSLHSD
ncbi:MAG: excinuclease ABC subunit UvrC [Pseudomonadota bacterium]